MIPAPLCMAAATFSYVVRITSKESDRVRRRAVEKSRVESERGAGPLIHMWSEERYALNHKLIVKLCPWSKKFLIWFFFWEKKILHKKKLPPLYIRGSGICRETPIPNWCWVEKYFILSCITVLKKFRSNRLFLKIIIKICH